MIALLLTVVIGSTYFPNGLVSNGHPKEEIDRVANTTALALEVADELPCSTLALSNDGVRFVIRPWDDGPLVVRVEIKSKQWITVTTKRLGLNSERGEFILEAQEERSLPTIERGLVRQQLARWTGHSTPFRPVEDGVEVIAERWNQGSCAQVLDPDFDFVATSLQLLGVAPDEAFASGRRKRPSN